MVTKSPVNVLIFIVFLELVDLSAGEFLKLPLLHRTPRPSPSEALSLDLRRLNSLLTRPGIKSPIVSGASSGTGQYFVALHLGNPPQRLNLVADTGSDLVWARCSACRDCSAHPRGSSFLARHSSSFRPHHCYAAACRIVPHAARGPRCNHTHLHSPCRYEYSYSDGSVSAGFFSAETATLNTSSNRVAQLKGLDFGCGFHVSGPSVTGASFNGAQGVMGLGRGLISFSSQLGRRFGNKFSYCLMDYTLSPPPRSFLVIGGGGVNATISPAADFSFTPLLTNPLSPTFYYIAIRSVFVDGVRIPVSPSVWSIDKVGNGGTIIDSGTTLTFLAKPAYRQVLAAMRRRVQLPRTETSTRGFDLCVNVTGLDRERAMALPRLSFKLKGGAVMAPPPRNYFIETAEGVRCLGIQAVTAEGTFSVIGNLMQQGFMLEFDRDRSRLGFSRHGCALSS